MRFPHTAKQIGLAALLAAVLFVQSPPAVSYAAAGLTINSQGKDVIVLQQKLQSLNYKISNIDGIFGAETKRAVLEFQRDKRIKITGVVDSRTWKELNRAKPAKIIPPKNNPPRYTPAPAVKTRETAPFVPQKNIPKIIQTAKSYIGIPYKFSGTTTKGFDCSGYVQYVFAKHNAKLPRAADEQFNIGKKIAPTALREGDLVFFTTYEKGASHCGIYVGNGKFIHVSSSKGVRIDELKDAYWKPKYLGAKRITI